MKDWNDEDWREEGKRLLLELGIVSNTSAQVFVGRWLKCVYEEGYSDGNRDGFDGCYDLLN
ncbi:hypothetical protein vBKpnPKlyazma_orf025 [Klebsiella phage vB_KpnP_Klyazma]|nr:hypothetical protein vBKpnPKlyazma_orf025 [Klebsiella phage vB_KpnP_Klyazma]